jgi:multiple sugar transport system ATP-binding protein
MAYVTLNKVSKDFGKARVIDAVDLQIEKGEFVVFVGPSGCGKSTLLRLVAGLETMTEGRLVIDGTDMTTVDSANRGIAMVFQSYALYPHMTVAENITFGMRMAKVAKVEIASKLARAAAMLHLEPLLERKPAQLSGGQRQRVAIGRAIVRDPSVFLFDEPLSNLDAALRHEMRIEILRLHKDLGSTMIYVTHDQVEAMTMADKIVVLNRGQIEQVGSPLDLYLSPDNLFVAQFLGSPKINCFPTVIERIDAGIADVRLPSDVMMAMPLDGAQATAGDTVTFAVRPEHFIEATAASATMHGIVELVEHLGSDTLLSVRTTEGTPITVRTNGVNRVRPGETAAFGLIPGNCQLFDATGKALVRSKIQ